MTQGNAETADAGASGLLRIERADRVLTVGLNRPAKRNALNDGIILEIGECFASLPEDIGAVVIHGIGDHFSSGLDLSELQDHDATGGLLHSQMWHRVFDRIQYSRVPVIAALRGAVIGGGLELACAAHIRVAEPSTYFALPEGQRGIFVGGGGSVRLPRLIGVARMMDMMLTGRVYSATEGASYGFTQYVTEAGNGLGKALELATKVASNAPLTNFAVTPGAADDRGGQSAGRPVDGIADGNSCAERQRGKTQDPRIPRTQDRKGEAEVMSGQPSSSSMERGASTSPLRPISFGDPVVNIERRDDGTIYLRPKQPLGDYPVRLTDRLHHWATTTPDRVFMAEREGGRGWRKITYAELLAASRHIASGLIARGLSAERPVVILSGNSIDHALLAFGAFYAGIPFCPVSPAYSLVSKDYGKLSYLMKLLTPGLVFAEDAGKFADALTANVSLGTEIAASWGSVPGRDVTLLADLMATPLHGDLDAIHDKIGPDTIAKFLLTSGSTGNPKAVINTQRMICANQVMLRETLAFLKDEPPVIIDWLPWNHTFGGNPTISG
ncbi:enoyl-CoA hydratase/carnithine racemase [Bradyrhizobium sp. i1.3.1]